MKHTFRAKWTVLICLIWHMLKVLSGIAKSMIEISLADEGFGKVREGIVIST